MFPASLSPAAISPVQDGRVAMKLPAFSGTTDHGGASRRWFRDRLWEAFPSRSERELSQRASRALGVSPRQVINWLREEHDARTRYTLAVLAIIGAEIVLSRVEGRR
jgi:hypothetical protein